MLSYIRQADVSQSSGSLQLVIRQSSDSHQALFRHSSGTPQALLRHSSVSSGTPQALLRQLSVIRQSSPSRVESSYKLKFSSFGYLRACKYLLKNTMNSSNVAALRTYSHSTKHFSLVIHVELGNVHKLRLQDLSLFDHLPPPFTFSMMRKFS